jgi:hypothetical protein
MCPVKVCNFYPNCAKLVKNDDMEGEWKIVMLNNETHCAGSLHLADLGPVGRSLSGLIWTGYSSQEVRFGQIRIMIAGGHAAELLLFWVEIQRVRAMHFIFHFQMRDY